MRNLKVNGIVLREGEFGEGNKILTVFSDTNGIISVRARRAKRTGYRYLASVQPFAYSSFELYKGRSMYSLNSAQLIEPFFNLRNDLDVLFTAGDMARICLTMIQQEMPEPESLRLLLNCLHFLNTGKMDYKLVYDIFRLRMLTLQGFAPVISSCGICERKPEGQDLVFSVAEKSIFCSECAKSNMVDNVELDYDTLAAILYICNSKLEKVFSVSVSDNVEQLLDYISGMLVKSCLEK